MTAITSNRTGNWSDTGAWVGGVVPTIAAGDTVTILTGHTITVDVASGCGASGATGTTALAMQGSLIINAPFTLKGDLLQDWGTSITGSSTGGNTGSLTWVSPSGSTYKWQIANHGTFGLGTNTFTGNASTYFIITTTQGGGGNTWFDGHTNYISNWTLTYVKFTYMGDGTNSGINSDQDGVNLNLSHVLFDHCGRIHWAGGSAIRNTIISNVDVRNTLDSTTAFSLVNGTDQTGGTRRISNLTIYSAARRELELQVRNLIIDTGCYLYNTKLGNSSIINSTFSKLFMVADVALTEYVNGVNGKNGNVWSDSVFYSHADNPHYIVESGIGTLANNIYQNNIFDGDNYWNSDSGDCIMPCTSASIIGNICINKAGTLGSLIDVNAIGSFLNNTIYHSYGVTIGETGGSPTQMKDFKNNLVVDAYAMSSPGNNPGDGVHSDTSFVKQSNFTLDYNGYFGSLMVGASGPLAIPLKSLVGTITLQAGTTPIHVVATGSPFTSIVAGDWVWNNDFSAPRVALVQTVTDANTLELSGSGIAGLTSGLSVQIRPNYWATPGQKYGDNGRGLHDVHIDPQFRDNTRTVATWDTTNGGAGTPASVGAQMVKINGFDKDGIAASPNSLYTVDNALAYIRYGFTPTNMALATLGESGTFLGALTPSAPGVPAQSSGDAPAARRPTRQIGYIVGYGVKVGGRRMGRMLLPPAPRIAAEFVNIFLTGDQATTFAGIAMPVAGSRIFPTGTQETTAIGTITITTGSGGGGFTADDWGADFRSTLALATDATNCHFVALDAYPTLKSGRNEGWTFGGASDPSANDDEGSFIPHELDGGVSLNSYGGSKTYQIDGLFAGATYNLRAAFGRIYGTDPNHIYCQVKDGSTVLTTISGSAPIAQWIDATNVLRTGSSDWGTNNAPFSFTMSNRSALLFSSTTMCENTTATNLKTNAHTFLMWFKASAGDTGNQPRLWTLGTGNEWGKVYWSGGQLSFSHPFTTAGGAWSISSPTPDGTTWYGFALTYDASNLANDAAFWLRRLGTDPGVVAQTVSVDRRPLGTPQFLENGYNVGNQHFNGTAFNGDIAMFQVYTSILTQAQIDAALNNPGSVSGSAVYLPLNGNGTDLSGNGFNATITSGSFVSGPPQIGTALTFDFSGGISTQAVAHLRITRTS